MPERTCWICREAKSQALMLRLVSDEEGVIWPDFLHKAPGRGFYLCMQNSCLQALNDKRLAALQKKHLIILPQYQALMMKLEDKLLERMKQSLHQLKVSASIGRDAVLHDLWKNRAMILLLSEDAGQALRKQLFGAVEKRQQAGQVTHFLTGFPSCVLEDVFQRNKVSVITIADSKQAGNLKQYCAWYERLKEAK